MLPVESKPSEFEDELFFYCREYKGNPGSFNFFQMANVFSRSANVSLDKKPAPEWSRSFREIHLWRLILASGLFKNGGKLAKGYPGQ